MMWQKDYPKFFRSAVPAARSGAPLSASQSSQANGVSLGVVEFSDTVLVGIGRMIVTETPGHRNSKMTVLDAMDMLLVASISIVIWRWLAWYEPVTSM